MPTKQKHFKIIGTIDELPPLALVMKSQWNDLLDLAEGLEPGKGVDLRMASWDDLKSARAALQGSNKRRKEMRRNGYAFKTRSLPMEGATEESGPWKLSILRVPVRTRPERESDGT